MAESTLEQLLRMKFRELVLRFIPFTRAKFNYYELNLDPVISVSLPFIV